MESINTNTILSTILLPVTFFDGETALDMGTVQITPTLTFKAFQSIISHKLQISPHQITIYFQNQNPTSYLHHNHRRRHPVTSKFDFKSVCNNESNSSGAAFWVVQKRSRRTRRRRNNDNGNGNGNGNGVGQFSPSSFNGYNNNYNHPGENFSILRRGEYFNEFDYRMSLLEKEKERYLMSMSLNSNVYNDLSFGAFFNGGGGYNGNFSDDGASSSGGASNVGFCEVCFSCRGDSDTVPFHWCKNDAVTKVFRSPAGPIAPPKKTDFLG